jgi:hypothetical protein
MSRDDNNAAAVVANAVKRDGSDDGIRIFAFFFSEKVEIEIEAENGHRGRS